LGSIHLPLLNWLKFNIASFFSLDEIQDNDKDPFLETKLGWALLFPYEKGISFTKGSLVVQEKTVMKNKKRDKLFKL
jgi:hypothetical protein